LGLILDYLKNNILSSDLEYIYIGINNKFFFKKKKILLIGSEGFIGFNLKNFFIKYFDTLKIDELTLIDNKFKKNHKLSKKIRAINFDLVKDNINLLNKKFDIIIHAASIASPISYRKYPVETCDVNVAITRNILEFSKKNKKTSVLYFSTSEIYGDPDLKNIPTKESYRGNVSCTGPRACYDESKRYAETLCYIYAKYYGVSVKVVRPFNNYGPGLSLRDGRVPSDFASYILKKNNLVLFSNGRAKRSFCYIADACIGYLNTLSLTNYRVLNIGNASEITIYKLAKIYRNISEKIFNFKPKIVYKINKDINYLKDSPTRRCPDLSNASKIIKYKAKISIYEGVKRYLEFLKNEKK